VSQGLRQDILISRFGPFFTWLHCYVCFCSAGRDSSTITAIAEKGASAASAAGATTSTTTKCSFGALILVGISLSLSFTSATVWTCPVDNNHSNDYNRIVIPPPPTWRPRRCHQHDDSRHIMTMWTTNLRLYRCRVWHHAPVATRMVSGSVILAIVRPESATGKVGWHQTFPSIVP
jgi:hypothetical protein